MEIKEKRIVERTQEIIFTNWTDEDFTHTYDMGSFGGSKGKTWIAKKKVYTFKAGKSYYLPFYLAEHFAKHLADREYNKSFQAGLDQLRKEPGAYLLSRVELENRVRNLPDTRKISLQEMLDKCVEEIPEENVDIVKPKEVPMREVVLKRDLHGQELRERFPGIEVSVNEKALKQSNEPEFEPA